MGTLVQTPRFTCEFESQWDRLPDWMRAYLDADICRALTGTCHARVLCSQTGIREVYGAMFVLYCADHDETREVIFLDFKPRDPDTPEPPARDAVVVQTDEEAALLNADSELADIDIFGHRRRNSHKPISMTNNPTGFEKQTFLICSPGSGQFRLSTLNIRIDHTRASNPAAQYSLSDMIRSVTVHSGVLIIQANGRLRPEPSRFLGNSPASALREHQDESHSDSIDIFCAMPDAIPVASYDQAECQYSAFLNMKSVPTNLPNRSYAPV